MTCSWRSLISRVSCFILSLSLVSFSSRARNCSPRLLSLATWTPRGMKELHKTISRQITLVHLYTPHTSPTLGTSSQHDLDLDRDYEVTMPLQQQHAAPTWTPSALGSAPPSVLSCCSCSQFFFPLPPPTGTVSPLS